MAAFIPRDEITSAVAASLVVSTPVFAELLDSSVIYDEPFATPSRASSICIVTNGRQARKVGRK